MKKRSQHPEKRIFRIKSIWLTTKGSAMSERGWITSRLISSVSTPLHESEDPTSVNTLLPPRDSDLPSLLPSTRQHPECILTSQGRELQTRSCNRHLSFLWVVQCLKLIPPWGIPPFVAKQNFRATLEIANSLNSCYRPNLHLRTNPWQGLYQSDSWAVDFEFNVAKWKGRGPQDTHGSGSGVKRLIMWEQQ